MKSEIVKAYLRQPRIDRAPPRPSVISITVAITLLTSAVSHAADPRSAAEIEEEIARFQQLLEKDKASLAEKAASESNAGQTAAKPNEEAQLGKVTVRGQNRRERLKDVPISTSVVTGVELDRELSIDLNSITRRTASIQFNQNNTRGASLSIRGLGRRSFTETQDPSVGLTVDGVSYGLTELGNFDFYDIDSVEVLRGPQGTLGGKGGSAGVVNILTRRPSFTRGGDFSLTYGQRDAVLAKANFGGPIIDDLLAWRGSVIADRGRGFYESSYDPNYSFYNRNRLGGRTQFLLTPTANLTARFSVDLEPDAPQVENGLTFYHSQPLTFANGSLTDPNGTTARAKLAGFTNTAGVFTGPRSLLTNRTYSVGAVNPVYTYNDYTSNRLLQNENQGQTVSNKGSSAEINYDAGSLVLTSITAWREYSFDAHNDEGTPFDISKNGGGGVFYRQLSQELRAESAPGTLFDYSGGLYFLKTSDAIKSKTGWGSDAGAWFATNGQYNTLERNAGMDRGAGIALLSDSLNDAFTYAVTQVRTKSSAAFGQIKWHFTKAVDVTTGLRVTREDRSSEDYKYLSAAGTGAALNPVAVRGVPLGGFASTTSGVLNTTDPTQIALADSVAQKYFGVANYSQLTTTQLAQVAAAKAIRAGQIGALSNTVRSTYRDTLLTGVISPSYKINDNFTAYTSWQYGEKSGSALNVNFVSSNVKPERTSAYELGFKSVLLDRKLNLNADLFYQDIHNYQSAVQVVDIFQTQTNIANGQTNPVAYVTAQGNVKLVRAQGAEIDTFFSGIPDTTLRFSGAYTDVRYKDFKNAAFPDDLAYLSTPGKPYTEQSGLVLPGISKWNFNVGAEYQHLVLGDRTFHASFNTSYNSRYNNTDTLSSYGWVAGYSRTDAAVGITTASEFDLSIVGKNVFDDRKHEQGWTSYSPYPYPQWFGVTVSGKL